MAESERRLSYDFEQSLNYATASIGIQFALKDKQIETLRSLYHGNDTIAVLPTGFGKSTIFHLLPWLFQSKFKLDSPMIVIVVCPLNSIMEDQVQTLSEMGLESCFLNIEGSGGSTYAIIKESGSCEVQTEIEDTEHSDSDTESLTGFVEAESSAKLVFTSKHVGIHDIKSGKYNLIFAHPETVVRRNTLQAILRSSVYQNRVCCTVVDEVHMVAEWGDEFRKDFKRLGELTCLFTHVPHLAVTATATSTAISSLTHILQFKNAAVVISNPNRPNIYIEKRLRLPMSQKYARFDDILDQIVPELKLKGQEFPVTIVYVENLEALGYSYQYTQDLMGEDAYHLKTDKQPENRVFAQYHKDYTGAMKRHVVSELRKSDPTLRLVFATVALGMGLNSKCITNIYHFRPPTSMEKYFQEIGRAGRAGQQSHAVMFYNNSDIASNRVGLSEHVKPFVLSKSCLRKHLLSYFGFDCPADNDTTRCCSNCEKDK